MEKPFLYGNLFTLTACTPAVSDCSFRANPAKPQEALENTLISSSLAVFADVTNLEDILLESKRKKQIEEFKYFWRNPTLSGYFQDKYHTFIKVDSCNDKEHKFNACCSRDFAAFEITKNLESFYAYNLLGV